MKNQKEGTGCTVHEEDEEDLPEKSIPIVFVKKSSPTNFVAYKDIFFRCDTKIIKESFKTALSIFITI